MRGTTSATTLRGRQTALIALTYWEDWSVDERLRWAIALEQRRLLDAGELSPGELRESCIDVIEQLNPLLG